MTWYKIREKMSKNINKDKPQETADIFFNPNALKKTEEVDFEHIEWSENGRYMAYML